MMNHRIGLVTAFVFGVLWIGFELVFVYTNFWWGAAFFLATFGSFLIQGLQKIKADPPHVGLVTLFGKRVGIVKKEGLRFFPFYPFVFGVIPIKVEKVNQDLEPVPVVRTPDLAEIEIPVSITWMPDKEDAKALIEFLTSGGHGTIEEEGREGVSDILNDIVRERLREWAFSSEEGPQTWVTVLGAREEVTNILLKEILGERIERIPSDIPTSILLRYFSGRLPVEKEDQERWGENWEILKEELPVDLERQGILGISEGELREAVEKRRKEIREARQGNGKFRHPQLGIVLNRLNIGEIKPRGKLAERAELRVTEEQERMGEVFEVETDLMKAEKLVEMLAKRHERVTLQQAFQIIMEWKATREGHGFTIPGISPAILEIARGIFGRKES